MYLFVWSFIAALISGRLAFRFDEHRSTYLSVCVAASAMSLVSGVGLVPESVWTTYSPHIFGMLLVIFFWTLRTQVRKVLLGLVLWIGAAAPIFFLYSRANRIRLRLTGHLFVPDIILFFDGRVAL